MSLLRPHCLGVEVSQSHKHIYNCSGDFPRSFDNSNSFDKSADNKEI